MSISLRVIEQMDFKVEKKVAFRPFARKSSMSLESKLETGKNCAEFFCCRLKGPQKEITGYGYRLPAAPHFLHMGLKVAVTLCLRE